MKTSKTLLKIVLLFSITVMQSQINNSKETIMKTVTFNSGGLNLAGHLYVPQNFDETQTYPAVIVGGSLTSVKEQMSATYAQKLAKNGIIALTFDYSHFGESEGQPRQYEDPENKLRDLKSAVTYLLDLPYVENVGGFGICTSAGNMMYLASDDERVKATASVAGWFPDEAALPLLYGSQENINDLIAVGQKAKTKYAETGENSIVLAYSNTDKTASHFGPMEYYMDKNRGGGVAKWKNEFSLMSWEPWLNFDPITKAENISRPTLIMHSDNSALPDNAKKVYQQLKGEKELVWLEGNHFDFYDQDEKVSEATAKAVEFFKKHLN